MKYKCIQSTFFISGGASLIFELVWMRWLTGVFGNTIHSFACVISVYLLGIAIGGMAGGYFSFRIPARRLLNAYASILILTGISAVISMHVFRTGYFQGMVLNGRETPDLAELARRFLLSGAVILIPTILMGFLFPVFLNYSRRFGEKGGAPNLYFINILGAAAGTLLAGFFLFELAGITSSYWISAAAYAAAGLMVFAFSSASTGAAPAEPPEPGTVKTEDASISPTVSVFVFLAGFIYFAFEILTVRILSVFLLNTVYSAALMTFVFLFGTSAGAFWMRGKIKPLEITSPGRSFIGVGLYTIAMLYFIGYFPWLTKVIGGGSWSASSAANYLGTVIMSVITILPVSFLLGSVFPAICEASIANTGARKGYEFGKLYFYNNLGSILGAALTGFFLIGRTGLRGTALILSATCLFAGAIITIASRKRDASFALKRYTALAVLAAAAALLSPAGMYLHSTGVEKVIFYKEGIASTVTVEEDASSAKLLKINGIDVAATLNYLKMTQKLQAHVPILIHRNPKRVLAVGLGSGGTIYSASLHDLEAIHNVEINPGVLEAAQNYFGEVNNHVFKDKRLKVIIDDGRHYLLTTREKYDVVLTESIHPAIAGNASLYTLEYFTMCRNALREGGVVSVWVPLYKISRGDVSTIIATFAGVFKNVAIWKTNRDILRHFILVGSTAEIGPGFNSGAARPDVLKDLGEIGIPNIGELMGLRVAEGDVGRAIDKASQINTDDRPVIEFSVPRSMYVNSIVEMKWK